MTYNVNMREWIQYFFPNEKYAEINNMDFAFTAINNHIYFATHEDKIASVIKYAKYGKKPDSFVQIGNIIGKILKENKVNADFIMAVPMHPHDQAKRGFNQSLLMARCISDHTGIPLSEKGIRKIKRTLNQASLNGAMRLLNPENAFVADGRICTGRTIMLVDDVCTTGTTLSECKKTLIANNAKRVIFITVTKKVFTVSKQQLLSIDK